MLENTIKRTFPIGTLPFSLLALLILVYVVYILFFPAPTKPDATWIRIQKEGVLRIGIDPSFPPFEADDGKGNLSGFDIALAAILAQKWNVGVQYVYTGFDGLYDALMGNQFDIVLSALSYNPQKTEDVSFSHSYFNGGPLLVVRTEDDRTKSIYDLAQRAVRVRPGPSAAVETLSYDHLVLAVGSVPHYYGLPGLEEHALSLKSLGDAIRLRDHVIALLERADAEADSEERKRMLTFVVVGGGFAGAETVAELFDLLRGQVTGRRRTIDHGLLICPTMP